MKNNNKNIGKGGNGGEIFIAARKIVGGGNIHADGGNGSIGGKGGKITIISEDNQSTGKISTKGGQTLKIRWWEKTWVQLIMLLGACAGIIGIFFLIT